MLKLNTKLIAPSLLVCLVAAGCSNKKAAAPKASAIPPMSQAAVPVTPAPPPAPPATFSPEPPAQPVVYEPAAEEPVVEEQLADASDSVAPVTRSRPRRSTSGGGGGTRYKVRKGESLWSIAQAKYGNGNKWKQIAAANPKIDPNRVQAGQTITLP